MGQKFLPITIHDKEMRSEVRSRKDGSKFTIEVQYYLLQEQGKGSRWVAARDLSEIDA